MTVVIVENMMMRDVVKVRMARMKGVEESTAGRARGGTDAAVHGGFVLVPRVRVEDYAYGRLLQSYLARVFFCSCYNTGGNSGVVSPHRCLRAPRTLKLSAFAQTHGAARGWDL